jgi:hypothetical protein
MGGEASMKVLERLRRRWKPAEYDDERPLSEKERGRARALVPNVAVRRIAGVAILACARVPG